MSLVLSRKQGERIIMVLPGGGTIQVFVADIRGDKVRLGIDADKNVMIHREEIMRRILEDQAARRKSRPDLSHSDPPALPDPVPPMEISDRGPVR